MQQEMEKSQTKVWLQVHRTVMGLVLLLTLAGFIIIFCYVEGFSEVCVLEVILLIDIFKSRKFVLI